MAEPQEITDAIEKTRELTQHDGFRSLLHVEHWQEVIGRIFQDPTVHLEGSSSG